ncbi:hypothetical protein EOPP23_11450 [Endozoicomonas sp. OPT23]|uniref:diguanylate cyclase domain-containing protein n=1 Tax=Endozoicomonas sp. OPT23 TaxID=2072845 RepID=UPI00129BFD18|nr:diguanylate cyclase [Endozoicomonas sp. OPT23]MRI33602.1 hypothetical protein [Endozoicomonas sp. OPT23]
MPSGKYPELQFRSIFGGLATTLSLWFFILSLGPVILIGLNEYHEGREAIEASRYEQLTTINELLSQQINDHFDQLVRSLYDTADSASAFIKAFKDSPSTQVMDSEKPSKSAEYQQLVDDYSSSFISFIRLHDFSNLLLLDVNGNILYTANSYGELGLNLFEDKLADTAFSQAARHALELGLPAYADVSNYPHTGREKVSFFILPLQDDRGNNEGLLAAQLPALTVQGFFDDLSTGVKGINSYLLGRDQKIRYGTDFDHRQIMKRRLEGSLVEEWLGHLHEGSDFSDHHDHEEHHSDYSSMASHERKHIKSYLGINGEKVLGTYHPIEIAGTELVLISEVPIAVAFSSIHHFRNRILLLSGIIVLVVLLLSILVSRWLVKPIIKVTRSVNRVAAGDYEATRIIRNKNEIGWLSVCVHEMTEQLREQQSALKKANKKLQLSNSELAEKSEQLLFRKEEIEHKNKEIEESSSRLIEKVAELEKASRYKSEFLANISHELRTPLNSMIILAQMMRDNSEGNLTNDQLESIEVIHHGSEELLELINDILDLSKVEAGKMNVEFSRVHIEELCQNLMSLFKPQAEQKKLSLSLSIDSGVNTALISDAQRLQQVLKNFLSNAFKFTQSGSVELSVVQEARSIGAEFKSSIVFTVKDTGVGIPADKKEIIFEAFQQADGSTSRKFGGTGLGLAISRELSGLLEGWIELESEENKGSSFSLILPADGPSRLAGKEEAGLSIQSSITTQGLLDTGLWQQPEIVEVNKKQQETEIQLVDKNKNGLGSSISVLVVDDRSENLLVLDKLLSGFDIEVCKAISGEEAVEQASAKSFAVILMDVQMPEMDGFEAASIIHSKPETANVPIIFVTALHRDKFYIKKGYQAGAVDYLSKPLDPVILKGKIKVFIDLERQRLQLEKMAEKLELSSRKNKHLLDSAGEGILGIDEYGVISFANPLAEELLEASGQSLIGQNIQSFIFGENSQGKSSEDKSGETSGDMSWTDSAMKKICFDRGEKYSTDDHRLWTSNKGSFPAEYSLTPVLDEQDKVEGAVLLFQNITKRKESEQQLNRMARYDELTGLANRALFQEYLEASLGRSKRRSRCTGVLFLDLDGFKEVNDSLGHDAGDELLKSVAGRLKSVVRQGDLLARLGGDEFAVILDDVANAADVGLVAGKFLESMKPTHELADGEKNIGVSIGVATTEDVGLNGEKLLKAADIAMYQAKKEGKNSYRLYSVIKGSERH